MLPAVAGEAGAAGDAVSVSFDGTAPAGTITFSAVGLPDGLIMGLATGIVSGTVAADPLEAPADVEVTATDGIYSTRKTSPGSSPTRTKSPPASYRQAQTSVAGQNVILALDADDTLDETFAATGLPDGLEIDAATGLITGDLSDDAVGTTPYSVSVIVTNPQGSASTTFDWTVANPQIGLQCGFGAVYYQK